MMSNTDLLEQLLSITIWKEIKGFENYEISICGQVRNAKTKRILKPHISSKGYYKIDLQNNCQRTKHTIHRLVLKTFIPNLEEKKCVDHINGIRLDNTSPTNIYLWSNQF